MITKFIYVILGSAIGGGLRYGLVLWFEFFLKRPAFWGLMTCNILGCFLAGILLAYSMTLKNYIPFMLFFVTGIMGGFTSFSAFGIDFYRLFESDLKIAFLYAFLTLIGSLSAVFLGIFSFGVVNS